MRFEKQNFTDTTITLDFNEFVGCTFKGCTLMYYGYSGFQLSGCDLERAHLRFTGPAGQAVSVLGAFYADPKLRTIAEGLIKNANKTGGEAPAATLDDFSIH
jgi:hypothetical protein